MAFALGPVHQLQYHKQCTSQGHWVVVHSRQHLQELEKVHPIVVDTRKTYILLHALSSPLLTHFCIHSRCWQKRPYVCHFLIRFILDNLYTIKALRLLRISIVSATLGQRTSHFSFLTTTTCGSKTPALF